MKKDADVKYPNSASLFQFCRRVLDYKFGGVRVIDQDVGQILGFDPADCSHWKKGKKNIRSIQAMKAIADYLGVDEKLVVDVASGEIDDREAFCEYSGYGAFSIEPKIVENAKKDFYRRNSGNWSLEREREFKRHFEIDVGAIDEIVRTIHRRIRFSEAPLYLPEVIAAHTELQANQSAILQDVSDQIDMTINEARPFIRFRLAKVMYRFFISPERKEKFDASNEFLAHVYDVESNLFAAKLLAPASLVRAEMANIDVARNIVSQLAENFWVSSVFMNRRLREILQNQPEI